MKSCACRVKGQELSSSVRIGLKMYKMTELFILKDTYSRIWECLYVLY